MQLRRGRRHDFHPPVLEGDPKLNCVGWPLLSLSFRRQPACSHPPGGLCVLYAVILIDSFRCSRFQLWDTSFLRSGQPLVALLRERSTCSCVTSFASSRPSRFAAVLLSLSGPPAAALRPLGPLLSARGPPLRDQTACCCVAPLSSFPAPRGLPLPCSP